MGFRLLILMGLALVGQVTVTVVPVQPIPQDPVHTEAERTAIHRRLMRLGTPGLLTRARDQQDSSPNIVATAYVVPIAEYPTEPDPESELGSFFCGMALVAVGRFGPGSSMATDDDSEIFTTRTFVVDEVLVNNRRAPLAPGHSVTVIHHGGTIVIRERRVSSLGPTVSHLSHLVLFGPYIPATGAYKTNLFAVELNGEHARVVNGQKFQFDSLATTTALLDTARKAAASLPASCLKTA